MLLSGKRYIGRTFQNYKIEDFIGQGRYGACFSAAAPDGSKVILKRFHNRMRKKNKEKNQFEPVILSQLEHPSIPSLLGIINVGSHYFLVLEQMPGKSIETLLFTEQHRFSQNEVYQIGMHLISIISYLHANNVVHRDIRPSNVLYEKGNLSLIDFGLARFFDSKKYPLDTDFSYLGDFLLYLLYSSYTGKPSKNKPWYEELPLSGSRQHFLKRLLGLLPPYQSMEQVKQEFTSCFSPRSSK